MKKRKPGAGRKPLAIGDPTVEIGFRCPKSLNDILVNAVEILKNQGHKTTKSEIIRALVGYRAANAAIIYLEMKRNKQL